MDLTVPFREYVERTRLLADVLRDDLLSDDMRSRAHNVFEAAVAKEPDLAKFRLVPQSPPHHAEGANLRVHVERMLACVLSIEQGAKLTDIEEFARDPQLALAIEMCERTIRDHAAFFKVFAIVHDVAKGDVLAMSAPLNTKGAREGFPPRVKEGEVVPHHDILQYDKLFRAFHAAHPELDDAQASVKFYDEYQIKVHFYGHDRRGAGPAYESLRAGLLQHFGVPVSFNKLLREVIWSHIDTLTFFTNGPDGKKFEVLAARAGKAGLNVDLFLDVLACCTLLDGVFGSLQYHEGALQTDPAPWIHLFRAEAIGMPQRTEARAMAKVRERKNAAKDALAEAKLSPDDVFALVQTPYGPERGVVMNAVYDAVRGHVVVIGTEKERKELQKRVEHARRLFTERHLSL